MAENEELLRKLVSHRARGFAPVENSAPAISAAAASGVPWIEIDTRVSRDGILFVFHDPVLRRRARPVRLCETESGELARLAIRGEPLLPFADALELFRAAAPASTRLMVDIKDYGFERRHMDLVAAAGLEERVTFVSWVPQVLLRFAELGSAAPLVFSHNNVLGRRPVGRSLWAAAAHRVRGDLVFLGPDDILAPAGPWAVGHTPNVTCAEIPGPFARALAAHGGGVCVALRDASPPLAAFCRAEGLKIAVFSARTVAEYVELAAQDTLDFVFSDDAPPVLAELSRR